MSQKPKELWFKIEDILQEDPDELYLRKFRVAGIIPKILEPNRCKRFRLKRRRSLDE